MLLNHRSPSYIKRRLSTHSSIHNGAYYYSVEITERIIPNVKTDRSWILLNQPGECADHSIVFIHNNLHPERYNWLESYSDLILVCGVPSTCEKVSHLGTPIYIPLSVNVEEVKAYRRNKDKDVCFVGRKAKMLNKKFPIFTDYLTSMPREQLLYELARYKKAYAVGRCAIEAKLLGCEVLPYDDRFPNPDIWKPVDNLDAAKLLQEELDKIDSQDFHVV